MHADDFWLMPQHERQKLAGGCESLLGFIQFDAMPTQTVTFSRRNGFTNEFVSRMTIIAESLQSMIRVRATVATLIGCQLRFRTNVGR